MECKSIQSPAIRSILRDWTGLRQNRSKEGEICRDTNREHLCSVMEPMSLMLLRCGIILRRKKERCTIPSLSRLTSTSMENRPSLSSESYPDRKSTRLNSTHVATSYAVFC